MESDDASFASQSAESPVPPDVQHCAGGNAGERFQFVHKGFWFAEAAVPRASAWSLGGRNARRGSWSSSQPSVSTRFVSRHFGQHSSESGRFGSHSTTWPASTRDADVSSQSPAHRHRLVWQMTSKRPPPEKLDMQTVDTQCRLLFQFLTSLLRFRSGWFANHALQATSAPPICAPSFSPFTSFLSAQAALPGQPCLSLSRSGTSPIVLSRRHWPLASVGLWTFQTSGLCRP